VAENIGNSSEIAGLLAEDAVIMAPSQPVQEGRAACARFVADVMAGLLKQLTAALLPPVPRFASSATLALTEEASRSPLHQEQAAKRRGKPQSISSCTRECPTVHGRLPARS
jgi:hypothetical protein